MPTIVRKPQTFKQSGRYAPTMDRPALTRLASLADSCATLGDVADLLHAYAQSLPVATTYTLGARAARTWERQPENTLRSLLKFFRLPAGGNRPSMAKRLAESCGAQIRRDGWREWMTQAGAALRIGRSAFDIFALTGNVKLPFVAFSTLPVITCPGAGECAKWCYSFTAWRYPAAFLRQLSNTVLLKHNPAVVADAFRGLPDGIDVRLYVDGDFSSAQVVAFWFDLCKERTDLQVYGYSKSWDEIVQYGTDGNSYPTNYTLNVSSGVNVRSVTQDQVGTLPIVRGEFVAVKIDRPAGHKGNVGFDRYQDPAYHRAVREAAKALGIVKPFSCPGLCGSCTVGRAACSDKVRFGGITIVNGIH